MIQATELRIWNWYDHNGTYRQATWDTIHEVWEAQRSWCKPIPLTEEILLKCPEYSIRLISKYKRIITFSNLKSDVCVFQQDSKVIRLFCDFRKNTFYIKYGTQKIYLKYLHQLQNLYHALTGEELTVNL